MIVSWGINHTPQPRPNNGEIFIFYLGTILNNTKIADVSILSTFLEKTKSFQQNMLDKCAMK